MSDAPSDNDSISEILDKLSKKKSGHYRITKNSNLDIQSALKIYYDYLKVKQRNKIEIAKIKQKEKSIYAITFVSVLVFILILIFLYYYEANPSFKKLRKKQPQLNNKIYT